MLTQPRPRGGIARTDAGCEPYLNRIGIKGPSRNKSALPVLQAILEENIPLALAIATEKARSELLIAPVLVEVRKVVQHRISLFSGVDFNVDEQQGLNGICDFIIARSPEQYMVNAPVIMLVEAKNEDLSLIHI